MHMGDAVALQNVSFSETESRTERGSRAHMTKGLKRAEERWIMDDNVRNRRRASERDDLI